jgi:hypothetical protein
MATQTLLSAKGMYKSSLMRMMPPWFDRMGCSFTEGKLNVHLNFTCTCGDVQQTVYVGKALDVDKPAKLATAVKKKHDGCHVSLNAAPVPPEELLAVAHAEIQRLDKAVTSQRRKTEQFEAENGLLKRKVDEARDEHETLMSQKRVKSMVSRDFGVSRDRVHSA